MVDSKTLLPELRALVTALSNDMLTRVTSVDTKKDGELREAHRILDEAERTAQSYEEWREDYLDQVAVAWVLSCVFVRFLEDNELINECYLAGDGDRRKLAEGQYEIYFRSHPQETDREYLKDVFTQIGKLPAAKELFKPGNTPLWAVDPSGDAARQLLVYFREIDAERGGLKRTFGTPRTSTQPLADVYQGLAPQARFLGDLYQDLSEHARKKFALLQTPEFVEQFILDRTLTQAIDEFGLKNLRLIDPTCGSGHFLLGAFDRLFREWMKPERGIDNPVVAAQNALDSIFGIDINSFAIAITRFRLFVALVQACGTKKLNQQDYAWRFNLAVGDSLLRGSKPTFNDERTTILHQRAIEFEPDQTLAIEDTTLANEILSLGFHVVVGNPPYITPRDRAQSDTYRRCYSTCHRQYSLGVPFTQRFWELAIRKGERIARSGEAVCQGTGYVGMITANSFMKREFGTKLIQEFFPKTDLTHVIDTSGAYIPGHGTPTVILFGRARRPVDITVRAVLGIKGEPTTPTDPAQGLVWRSIVRHIDIAGAQDDFTSSVDVPRTTFASHPWTIGGGGASGLQDLMESKSVTPLGELTVSIGRVAHTGSDEAYIAERGDLIRKGVPDEQIAVFVEGDRLRDWLLADATSVLFPYDSDLKPIKAGTAPAVFKWLWHFRDQLWNRREPNGTHREIGKTWYEFSRFHPERYVGRCIAFAFVATHNHFVLDGGGKVFKQSAPIIKLRPDATEDDYISLLGLLNSSIACFWMKQAFHNKGGQGINEGAKAEHWEKFYEYTGTGLERFPVPEGKPLTLSQRLDACARQLSENSPPRLLRSREAERDLKSRLAQAEVDARSLRGRMIALQEELDWECYRHYGLIAEDLCYPGEDLPELATGQRAFEIVMARQMRQGTLKTAWFERHGSTALVALPSHWPAAYRALVERRIKLVETSKEIALVEKPEHKRRWSTDSWAEQQKSAIKDWLLDRLEGGSYWRGIELQSVARLADRASGDVEFMQVAECYRGRQGFDVAELVAELVEAESVPLLSILRYKASGLRKRAVWERTWELQRQGDERASRRVALDQQLNAIRQRVQSRFGDDSGLAALEEKFRRECLAIRNEYAPHIEVDARSRWSAILDALRGERLKGAGSDAFRGLLDRSKEISEARQGAQARVAAALAEDREYTALAEARASIPDDTDIAVPPRYTSADYQKTDYWRLRGKLDVPKERWVSYPNCHTDSDPSLLVGWAGWNHLQQAGALIGYYDTRKREGWDAKRLTPLLAGLDQLLPWIHQWHPEVVEEFGETAGKSYQTLLEHDAHELGLTLDDIRNWQPPAATRRRARK